MDLDVREVARLLNVTEKTIYRWARDGALPASRVHDQYRFNRVELQEWAASTKHRVSPELFAPHGAVAELPSLVEALARGGISRSVPGHRREEVLDAVTRLPGIPISADRALLLQLLVGREALASTAIGEGFALPHPRDPLVVKVDHSVVLLCFLAEPVDFGAVDGQPVRVLFTLLSPSVRAHLQMLSRIAYALHDETFRALVGERAPDTALTSRLAALEASPPDEGHAR